MGLRKLKMSDAPYMLEWMHDQDAVALLPTHFEEMTMGDCETFIQQSLISTENIHLAICNEHDDYIGTVSLKHVDRDNLSAEFAIVINKKAWGKGYARQAFSDILQVAFANNGLNRVYLCVFEDNVRAVKLYRKLGLHYEGMFRKHIRSKDGKFHDLCWYSVLREEWLNNQDNKGE